MHLLTKAEDVDAHVLVLVANCVEDWFPPERALATEAFLDRLCNGYIDSDGWDIEQMDTPAVRKIMRHARHTRQEML
jgi:hypothetical protein